MNRARLVGSAYHRPFLLLRAGPDEYHEMVHFFQHVGTTAGIIQLMMFHMNLKAMANAFRGLARHQWVAFPIDEQALEALREEGETQVLHQLQLALKYRPFLARLDQALTREVERWEPEVAHWYSAEPPESPLVRVNQTSGFRLGTDTVEELQNYAIALERGDALLSGPEAMLLRILEYRCPWVRDVLCWVCDWSLMAPHPNYLRANALEAWPAWRFVQILDALSSLQGRTAVGATYVDFCDQLASRLHWHSLGEVTEQIQLLGEAAYVLGRAGSGAFRNRSMYREIARLSELTYEIRARNAEAFAKPHLFADAFPAAFRPLATLTEGGELNYYGAETPCWYGAYVLNGLTAIEAYSQSGVQCDYIALGRESACPDLRDADLTCSGCIILGSAASGTLRPIKCGFLRFLGQIGYEDDLLQRALAIDPSHC